MRNPKTKLQLESRSEERQAAWPPEWLYTDCVAAAVAYCQAWRWHYC